jgi:RNA-dependent RNA polymerase
MSLRSPRSAPRPRSALPDRNRHSSHSSSQGTFSSASFRPADEWRTRPSILIKVSDLPSDISTEHIWQWFKSSGNIVWIDVLEPNNRHGKSAARIRFEPPPRRTLWALGPMTVQHPDPDKYPAGLRLRISLWDEKPSSGSKLTYPEKVLLNLNSLAFGSMLNPTLMRVMKSISSASSRTLLLEFDTKRGNMSIFFSTGSQTDVAADWESPRQWKVTFQLSNIKKILESVGHDGSRHWVFSLPYPPQYFGKVDKILGTLQCNPQRWSTNDTWYRATDIDAKNNQLSTGPISLHNEVRNSGQVDIGRWTTFRLSFDSREAGNKVSYPHFTSALSLSNPSVPIHPGCDFDNQAGAPNLWDYLEHPSVVHGFQPSALLEMPPKILLPFQVRYQLEVCVSRGLMNEYTIGIDFLEKLASLQERDATLRLEYLVDQNEKLVDPMSLFQMQDAEVYAPTTKIPHYCTYVRKASITPTTIRFNSPTVETSNRVVRKYSHIQDRFLRVQFLEECESYRVGKNQQINDQVWKRVERTLFQGIRIGDRYYEFLAFGSSQLRQCSAYFFCPTDHLSCDDIRAWMGQFDHIKCAAKYGARLGQCFSTTRDIKGVVIPHIRQVDDIMRNGQCFTDGVGLISEFLSKLIMGEMTLDVFDKPTAFQFRMGGCKGVLAVWPQAKGMEVHVRPSQEKFKSDFRGLEIVRCAARSTATLNRQTIPLLECLGVPRQVFLKLLKDQINWFENAKHDNSVAIELLTKFVDENQSSLILAELLKAGFKTDGNQEPFALNIFNLWVSWSFRLLREKARIHVPKSAFVLGCVDESGTLRGHSIDTEGSAVKDEDQLPQIFLQLTDPNHNGQTEIIKGVCIVGRNPSLHPGDIRVVQAVDAPELRHLKDVVVFSSKGDKPVPSMLSGGDLDGDDFFIIWDAGLIPTEWNHRPMCYEAPAPKQLNRDVVVDDLRKFFVNFMKNDVLALIAVSHLALADKHGPKSAICKQAATHFCVPLTY